MFPDEELAPLLRAWRIPTPAASLDIRVTHTFLLNLPIKYALQRVRNALIQPEVSMKRCNSCGEEFEDKFSFCPVDATPLNSLAAELAGYPMQNSSGRNIKEPQSPHKRREARPYEYHLTILSSRGLAERLVAELRFTLDRLKTTWPDLRRDPIGFGKMAVFATTSLMRERIKAPTLASGLAAMLVVLSAVLLVALMDRVDTDDKIGIKETGTESVEILTIPMADQPSATADTGVVTGSQGRVGFYRGRGEGSEAKPKRAGGGGGGGLKHELAAQQGKPPAPSEIPAAIPQLPPARKLALPVAGIDLDPAVWRNLPFSRYGDPRSSSTTPSNGPGDEGGMGKGTGPGVGEGDGDGFGPGTDGNIGGRARETGGGGKSGGSGNDPYDPDRVLPASMAGQRARVLSKPEPQYTEEARRNQITGTVVLRVIFSRSGEVTNIRAIHSLPLGLTEKAIAAARQIRFLPATKDGHPVSVYMQLEYNFNLY